MVVGWKSTTHRGAYEQKKKRKEEVSRLLYHALFSFYIWSQAHQTEARLYEPHALQKP